MKIQPKEALEILQNIKELKGGTTVELALDMAIDALKKEIPVEPCQPKGKVRYGMGYEYCDYYCPTCMAFLEPEPKGNTLTGLSVCLCGQKIIWGKRERGQK